MVILTFVFFFSVYFILLNRFNFREAFVWAILVHSVCLLAFTEILSIFRVLNITYLIFAWGLASLVAVGVLFKFKLEKFNLNRNIMIPFLDNLSKIILTSILLITIITLFVALIAPPNNYDSMTYHMSRVVHWAQNESVVHYQTGILRQLYMPPAAEFVVLNFQILTGSDLFANFVQWFSMFMSLILVSLIAKELGGDRKAQLFSAFICSIIPMGIMQATSTQTDYFTAMWVLSFAYFTIAVSTSFSWTDLAGAGLSCGFALLSKPTAYLFVLPFCLWLLTSIVKNWKWGAYKPMLMFILLILMLNVSFYCRNMMLFGSPLWSQNGEVGLSLSVGNNAMKVIKCAANNFNSPVVSMNHFIYSTVNTMGKMLNVDINDANYSAFGEYKIDKYTPHEDVIGNPIHLLLILFFLVLYLSNIRKQNGLTSKYILSLIMAILLFFSLIKYQPWLNRLTLPIVVMFSPLLGIAVGKIRNSMVVYLIFILMIVFAIPPLFMNVTRPIIPPPGAARSKYSLLTTPREHFYFAGMPETHYVYKNIVVRILKANYKNLGLIGIDNEYPLWVLLNGKGVRVEHVEVKNESSVAKTKFDPQVIVAFSFDKILDKRLKKKYPKRTYLDKDSLGYDIYFYERK